MESASASGNQKILHLDLQISEDDFQNGAKQILQHIRPAWKEENIKFKVFTDGITNKLLGCSLKDNGKKPEKDDTVLVRMNGQGTEVIIDRQEEQQTFRILSAAGLAPPVYCVFGNGMAYGFFPGEPLDEKSVREPIVQRLIAEEMVRLHQVPGPCEDGKPVCELGCRMKKILSNAPTSYDDPTTQEKFVNTIPSKDKLQSEMETILKELDSLHMDIVYSHNDLLLKNIILNRDKCKVNFIDYEYAFYNYEAYDIADHFTEYAGIDEVDYDLYPSKEDQLPWLQHYLESKAEVQGKARDSVTPRDVERFYIQVNKSACAAHFFWGIWALIQAKHSAIDFDYIGYADIRLTEYFRRKAEFFPLQLDSC